MTMLIGKNNKCIPPENVDRVFEHCEHVMTEYDFKPRMELYSLVLPRFGSGTAGTGF